MKGNEFRNYFGMDSFHGRFVDGKVDNTHWKIRVNCLVGGIVRLEGSDKKLGTEKWNVVINTHIEKLYIKIINNMHSAVMRKMDGGEMLGK